MSASRRGLSPDKGRLSASKRSLPANNLHLLASNWRLLANNWHLLTDILHIACEQTAFVCEQWSFAREQSTFAYSFFGLSASKRRLLAAFGGCFWGNCPGLGQRRTAFCLGLGVIVNFFTRSHRGLVFWREAAPGRGKQTPTSKIQPRAGLQDRRTTGPWDRGQSGKRKAESRKQKAESRDSETPTHRPPTTDAPPSALGPDLSVRPVSRMLAGHDG